MCNTQGTCRTHMYVYVHMNRYLKKILNLTGSGAKAEEELRVEAEKSWG